MDCIQCGAELRPDAKFCNVCGARQPEPGAAPAVATATGEENTQGAPGSETAARETAEADDGARVKRPARVPRQSEDDEDAGQQPAAENGVVTNLLPEEQARDEGESKAQAGAGGTSSAQVADAAEIAEASAADFYAVASDGERAEDETNMPALVDLSRDHLTAPTPSAPETVTDGMPWPLPVHMIVGGRYRVERMTATMPDAPGAENQYMVSDLQGYERCWSCGTEYGQSAATDQFCRECGADMLARDYVMTERRLSPGAAQEQPAQAAPAAAEAQAAGIDGTEQADDGAQDEASEQQVAQTEAPAAVEAEGSTGQSEAESGAQVATVREFTQGARAYHVEPYVPEPVLFPRGARIVAAAATDAGQVRSAEGNEDSVGLFVFNALHGSVALPLALCVVADGLGGHVSGQDASRLVVRALTDHVLRSAALPLVGMAAPATPPDDVLREVLLEGAQAANAAVYAANQSSGADSGSTIVAALICGNTAYIANAGDSRGYVLDDGTLRRITTDHSLVEQLVAGGLIAPEDRYTHPKRNQIFRSLGDEPTAAVDVFTQKLRPGMRLLLCSDGLWEMVRDDEMAAILRETANPREACDILVRRANEHGGEDNISALVIEVSD